MISDTFFKRMFLAHLFSGIALVLLLIGTIADSAGMVGFAFIMMLIGLGYKVGYIINAYQIWQRTTKK